MFIGTKYKHYTYEAKAPTNGGRLMAKEGFLLRIIRSKHTQHYVETGVQGDRVLEIS
jgi:hypothetical protein